MDNTKSQKIISFCTGYGGIELGLELAGVDVEPVCYVEIEAFATANLVAKIEEGKMAPAPVWTNLKTFNGEPFFGKVHGIIGGYPCQPFSTAGKRLGEEDPRHLWPYIEKHIKAIRPEWCFFENVFGHLSKGFDIVVKSLQGMGYAVEAGIFSAEEVGLPHQRKRLFILSYSKSIGNRGRLRNLHEKDEIEQRPKKQYKKESGKFIHASEELANTRCYKSRGKDKSKRTSSNPARFSEELANTKSIRTQRMRPKREQKSDIPVKEKIFGCNGGRAVARPGEPQHEWEEPRTVESGMGRTVDGFASRVDELRLLGNGVVPATAAKAWISLWNKMKDVSENGNTDVYI